MSTKKARAKSNWHAQCTGPGAGPDTPCGRKGRWYKETPEFNGLCWRHRRQMIEDGQMTPLRPKGQRGCSTEACGGAHHALGLCWGCYYALVVKPRKEDHSQEPGAPGYVKDFVARKARATPSEGREGRGP